MDIAKRIEAGLYAERLLCCRL
ncbi:hypothetical protein [Streptomyces sp. NPDC001833]